MSAPGHYTSGYVPPVAISVLAFTIAVFHGELSEHLQYQSGFNQSGEVWRLLTAHFVHLDWPHLMLNLLGLWLLWLLVGTTFNTDQWLFLGVLLSVFISMGLKIFSPEVTWYVGLSGLLYGMFSCAAVVRITGVSSPLLLLLAVILLKTILESATLPISLLDLTAHRVVVDAHVYGIVSGMVCGGVYRWIEHKG